MEYYAVRKTWEDLGGTINHSDLHHCGGGGVGGEVGGGGGGGDEEQFQKNEFCESGGRGWFRTSGHQLPSGVMLCTMHRAREM